MPYYRQGRKMFSAAEKAAYYRTGRPTRSNGAMASVSGSGAYNYRPAFSKAKQYLSNNYRKPYRYPGAGAKYGSKLGRVIGGFTPVGGEIGSMAGNLVGRGAHALMKTVTGFGDYNVSKNSLIYNADAVPQFSNNQRCTVIAHREFVSDIRVLSANVFNNQSFTINPANAMLFPWLSQIATNYEEYVFQGLLFEFKTTSATAVASTNTSLGTVVLCTQYNSLAPAFINKQQMENYEFCQSGVPSSSIIHPAECDPALTANQGLFYVNNPDEVQTNADPRLYNLGVFNIATAGMQAASTIGELWVTYKVCFLKPRLSGTIAGSDHWILPASTVVGAAPFGATAGSATQPTLSTSSTSYNVATPNQALSSLMSSPWTGNSASDHCYINPDFVGNIVAYYQYSSGTVATGTTGTMPYPNVFGNIVFLNNISVPSSYFSSVQYSTVSSTYQMLSPWVFQCNGGYSGAIGPGFQISGGVNNFTPTQANLAIFTVPANITN